MSEWLRRFQHVFPGLLSWLDEPNDDETKKETEELSNYFSDILSVKGNDMSEELLSELSVPEVSTEFSPEDRYNIIKSYYILKLSEKGNKMNTEKLKNEIIEIEKRFTYHEPNEKLSEKYNHLRYLAGELAIQFNFHCPESRERSLAITKLEEAVMWANAAIARRSGDEN